MSAVINEHLVTVAKALRTAGHGEKQAIKQRACDTLLMSPATLHRKLKELTVTAKPRKQRTDAGKSDLTRDEAKIISGVLIDTLRRNGKMVASLKTAVQALRADGFVRAERLDQRTGELVQLSESAINRALRSYGLHPDQLLAPTPHTSLKSLHPNHCWQIDASLCVLYYLTPQKNRGANGLQVMAHDEFYKNKPKNLDRITANRVWSYEITDHTSGWIYVEYVMGAESGENLCHVLINAMQERGGPDMLHGVPKILYMDPGSANTSAMTMNLCKSLGIEAIAHAPGAARATGQVENARNLIEKNFEFGLKFRPVADLAELNALAAKWRSVWNATAVHRRHGKTRTACWMMITEDQLVKAPPVEVCRELAIADPVERKVNSGKLGIYISFGGAHYDLTHVPGVMINEKVLVTRNPWRDDAAQLVMTNAEGRQVFHVIQRINQDEHGFPIGSPVIGENYNRIGDTVAQTNRKDVEQVMTGTDSVEKAEAYRKAKHLPLGGQFDPYKATDDAQLPTYLPRRGTEHKLTEPLVELPRMTLFAAAKRLMNQFPEWNKEHFSALKASFPDGVREHELEAAAERVRASMARPKLSVVGGNQ